MKHTNYKVEALNELSKQVNSFVAEIGFDNAEVKPMPCTCTPQDLQPFGQCQCGADKSITSKPL